MIVWVPMMDAKLMLAFIAQDLHKFVVLARFITARIIARLFLNFWTARVNVLIHKQIWISSAWNSENLMA
jgi:hypothetical protein